MKRGHSLITCAGTAEDFWLKSVLPKMEPGGPNRGKRGGEVAYTGEKSRESTLAHPEGKAPRLSLRVKEKEGLQGQAPRIQGEGLTHHTVE